MRTERVDFSYNCLQKFPEGLISLRCAPRDAFGAPTHRRLTEIASREINEKNAGTGTGTGSVRSVCESRSGTDELAGSIDTRVAVGVGDLG